MEWLDWQCVSCVVVVLVRVIHVCRNAFDLRRLLLCLWSDELKLSSVFNLTPQATCQTHTQRSTARSTPLRASVCASVLWTLVWSGIMLICPWWRHSHRRLRMIVRRETEWGRKERERESWENEWERGEGVRSDLETGRTEWTTERQVDVENHRGLRLTQGSGDGGRWGELRIMGKESPRHISAEAESGG